jgi:hypothetical protein
MSAGIIGVFDSLPGVVHRHACAKDACNQQDAKQKEQRFRH